MGSTRVTGKCWKGQDDGKCRAYRRSGSRRKDSCGFGGASEFLPGSADSADFASPAAFASGGGSRGPLTPQPAKPAQAAPTRATAIKDFVLRKSAAMPKPLQNPLARSRAGTFRRFLDLSPALFQPLEPLTCHFDDILWRRSPIAGPALDRILDREHRKYGFRNA